MSYNNNSISDTKENRLLCIFFVFENQKYIAKFNGPALFDYRGTYSLLHHFLS